MFAAVLVSWLDGGEADTPAEPPASPLELLHEQSTAYAHSHMTRDPRRDMISFSSTLIPPDYLRLVAKVAVIDGFGASKNCL
jgi:hypothetical protein